MDVEDVDAEVVGVRMPPPKGPGVRSPVQELRVVWGIEESLTGGPGSMSAPTLVPVLPTAVVVSEA